jgi:hypothetical protein
MKGERRLRRWVACGDKSRIGFSTNSVSRPSETHGAIFRVGGVGPSYSRNRVPESKNRPWRVPIGANIPMSGRFTRNTVRGSGGSQRNAADRLLERDDQAMSALLPIRWIHDAAWGGDTTRYPFRNAGDADEHLFPIAFVPAVAVNHCDSISAALAGASRHRLGNVQLNHRSLSELINGPCYLRG